MLKEAIFHKIDSEYIYSISQSEFLVRLRTKKDDVEKINLLYFDRFNYPYDDIFNAEMTKTVSDGLFDYYETVIDADVMSIGYSFQIKNDKEILYYGNYTFANEFSTEMNAVFMMPAIHEEDNFDVPEWAQRSIVYQIFPERFYNGDLANDPRGTQLWYSEVTNKSMLGGDLKGIIQKLDYIEELGVNTIYLTPIFESDSSHKYDTYNYYKIDSHFGDLKTFKELVKEVHKRNMRVILDAVFNHCGDGFPPFVDAKEKGRKSKYKDWFDIRESIVEGKVVQKHRSFGYISRMPKLMTKNEETARYLIDVATYWIRETDIDGWRLDVADEVGHSFWREFRKAIKKVKSDALIIGEVWYDSSSWLRGDQFDTVMNYLFRNAVEQFVALENLTVEQFDASLGFIRSLYMRQAYNILWNLIGSHDTERFLSVAKGDVRKLKLAVLVQMTFTGTPLIYYGDEVGMTGGYIPDCRRGMVWEEEKQNRELLEYYKKLIRLRKKYKAMQLGDFKTIYIDNYAKIYGYKREYKGQVVKIFLNSGDKEQCITLTIDEANVNDILNDRMVCSDSSKVIISIAPKSGVILVEAGIKM